MQDKNFDTLTSKFAKNIYGTPKGKIRAAVLWRDLTCHIESLCKVKKTKKLRILDAGGGFGFISQQLAALGHHVTLCDISAEMLAEAESQIANKQPAIDMRLIHCSIQDLSQHVTGKFDLILCHAVAEWLSDAEGTLTQLLTLLDDDGLFSLMFFNKEAMRFHALISGNFDYVAADFNIKKKVRLTPTHPLFIHEVRAWFQQWQLSLVCQSGVRVINDYLKHSLPASASFEQVLAMELAYCQQEPYLSLGRYVHFIGHKPRT
ncbi:methyltransferase domain-containing protein [Shewanella sp. NIFS-20-20]|uniref:methyltransferase domain-containing protein n=1 Tax=Shewanella sp. NIFS-20-20 TaxID=2853806 RepID=UPI001C4671C2|nr:methyltransferase domain-containing protein [Shewanella sp. NIFS-20-20]